MEICIVGCGTMGSAIARGLAQSGQTITLYDRNPHKAEALAKAINGSVCRSPCEGNTENTILLLAIKPKDFHQSISSFKDFSGLIVSVLLGVTIEGLKKAFPGQSVLRMMPNTAVEYGKGVLALAKDPELDQWKTIIDKSFSPLGLLHWLPEGKFDGITALTGSGPAFVFAMIESMVDAAITMGLSADEGYLLAQKMVEGSLFVLEQSDKSASELRMQVCSPAGSTITGMRAFEKHGVRSGIIETFLATYQRSHDLIKELE